MLFLATSQQRRRPHDKQGRDKREKKRYTRPDNHPTKSQNTSSSKASDEKNLKGVGQGNWLTIADQFSALYKMGPCSSFPYTPITIFSLFSSPAPIPTTFNLISSLGVLLSSFLPLFFAEGWEK